MFDLTFNCRIKDSEMDSLIKSIIDDSCEVVNEGPISENTTEKELVDNNFLFVV